MHIHFLDAYQGGPSRVHRLDPRVKLVAALAFILAISLIPTGAWLGFGLLFGLLLVVIRLARLPVGLILRRSFIALPFALISITVIFTTHRGPGIAIPLGPWDVTLSVAGIVRFVSIVLRSWLSVNVAILLTTTTTFPDLLRAMRDLRFPRVLVGIISFMYRYLFVMADEALRLNRARVARSAVLPGGKAGGTLLWRARVLGGMVGSLFIRSYERSERIYHAMVSRGYTGRIRTLTEPALRPADVLQGVAFGVILFAIELLSWVVR